MIIIKKQLCLTISNYRIIIIILSSYLWILCACKEYPFLSSNTCTFSSGYQLDMSKNYFIFNGKNNLSNRFYPLFNVETFRGGSMYNESEEYSEDLEVNEVDNIDLKEDGYNKCKEKCYDVKHTILSSNIEGKKGLREYDKPFHISPIQEVGLILGTIMLCNRVDLTNKRIIKLSRFAFISYIVSAQVFYLYVRIKAKGYNDRTPITIVSPLTNILNSKIIPNNNGCDVVKSIANSLLTTYSSVVEYDLNELKRMNNSLFFPMIMLWFLHFKMNQVHPLLFQTVTGFKDILTCPLFQVYVLSRNLERPFQVKKTKLQSHQFEQLLRDKYGVEDIDKDLQDSNGKRAKNQQPYKYEEGEKKDKIDYDSLIDCHL